MNKFLSKIAATALCSTIAIYAANGPTWEGNVGDGNTSVPEGGFVIGADTNLTMHLNADMQTSAHFDLVFNGGGVADTAQYSLCSYEGGGTLAGTYVTARDIENDKVHRITFEFEDNETIIEKGDVLYVISGSSADCNVSKTIHIVPDSGSCVTVKSENGQDQSGNVDIAEINSDGWSDPVVKYRDDILISCSTPVCNITNSGLEFGNPKDPSFVNYRAPVSAAPVDSDARLKYCENTSDCDAPNDDPDVATPCTAYISIRNNTDKNITELSLTPSIISGAVTEGMTYIIDANGTKLTATLGNPVVIKNLELNKSVDQNISITFQPDNTHQIEEAVIKGNFSNIVSTDDAFADASFDTNLSKFTQTNITTDFTVTYMNRKQKSFVMITAKEDTPVTATITDMYGKTAEATDCPSLKKGETKFYFSDEKEHADTCLVKAADAKELADAWSVTFHVNSSVDVAAYTDLGSSGQRTLTVLYAEPTDD